MEHASIVRSLVSCTEHILKRSSANTIGPSIGRQDSFVVPVTLKLPVFVHLGRVGINIYYGWNRVLK